MRQRAARATSARGEAGSSAIALAPVNRRDMLRALARRASIAEADRERPRRPSRAGRLMDTPCRGQSDRRDRTAQEQFEHENGELSLLARLDRKEPDNPLGAREGNERVPLGDDYATETVAFEAASFEDAPDGSNRSGEIEGLVNILEPSRVPPSTIVDMNLGLT
jgi:hypothetical protein